MRSGYRPRSKAIGTRGGGIKKSRSNRAEEAVGSAKDIWTAFREGRFGQPPPPFLGYLFLLEDRDNVKTPVGNKEPYFQVDPEFRGETYTKAPTAIRRYRGVSYSTRYELLCRRLILERLYSASCFLMATNSRKTKLTQPAEDLTFRRFAAACEVMSSHSWVAVASNRESEMF
ncbi:MAG: hypothetical protein H8K06_11035 [Nitrospira sp.]|nr:hypothetical protein [Nitrospira sp.]